MIKTYYLTHLQDEVHMSLFQNSMINAGIRFDAWRRCALMMVTLALMVSGQARADWILESGPSSLNFVSIKNNAIAEAHTFKSLRGSVEKGGGATVYIDLDSVETLIPVRNERIRNLLLSTSEFPAATITSSLDLAPMLTLSAGEYLQMDLTFNLGLHGVEATKTVAVRLFRLSEQAFQVSSIKPLMINAADFGLTGGIEALREIASLQSITPVVPVSFSLVFRQAE